MAVSIIQYTKILCYSMIQKIMIHSIFPAFGICEVIIRVLVNWWADQVKFKPAKSFQLLEKKNQNSPLPRNKKIR